MTVVGIALASAIMMVGNFQEDSIDFMVDVQFSMSQREDLSVNFVEPTSRASLYELREPPRRALRRALPLGTGAP